MKPSAKEDSYESQSPSGRNPKSATVRAIALFVFQSKAPSGRSSVAPEERCEDVLLFAYVDGELDEDQRRLVEELLARDPDARQRVAQFRELNALLKAAYQKNGDDTA
jgi:hypothetical protein